MSLIANKRKEKSLEILKKEGVPYLELFPPYHEDKLRTKEEICIRAMCLMVVAFKGEGLNKQKALEVAKELAITNDFSPEELAFLNNENPDPQDKINFLWRYESLWILLWVLGYVKELKRPEDICNVSEAVSIIKERKRDKFIEEAMLKPVSEILDIADLTFRYHWAVRNAWIKKEEPPAKLDPSVIYERRYALEWLLNNHNEDWDNIDTPT
ncbi:MAG: DUF4272 domain-containing protein [Rickettsia endosymbiont of Graphium doson]|nr:DUF4272 domain-containing protein [Rickettsia endosymbiont of Graphium doson]